MIDRSPPPPDKLVGALSSGLAVLRYLAASSARAGVTRVARDLGLNSSTCFNILRTLVHERLVSFDPASKTYGLSLGLVELAKGALEQASYARMVHDDLEALAANHQVTAVLFQKADRERVVLVDRAEASAAIRVHMSIGQRLPMYVAALGRCMAAHSGLSRAELKERFASLHWEVKLNFTEYMRDVERARSDGYAIDQGHFFKGVTTVSAAVLDPQGQPLMAISTVGFSAQFDERRLEQLALDVRDTARRVTRAISGQAGLAPAPVAG